VIDGRRALAAAGSVVFFIAPATVAGYVPWALTRWREERTAWNPEPVRWAGYALVAAGLVVILESFARFAMKGLGTPAPIAPPRNLVVSGFYRYVRNPMYVAVVSAIMGQALVLGSARLVGYAVLVWLAFTAFVMLYEEPTLHDRFGASYEAYRAHVGRWWPRARPWEGR
jgi:protein-S-isoprenylcysteine O-methyltransferase Ste14